MNNATQIITLLLLALNFIGFWAALCISIYSVALAFLGVALSLALTLNAKQQTR